jgi:hypothetical protein
LGQPGHEHPVPAAEVAGVVAWLLRGAA